MTGGRSKQDAYFDGRALVNLGTESGIRFDKNSVKICSILCLDRDE
jgi:hypothetical protein